MDEDRVGGDSVQKPSVMRHCHHRLLPLDEELLEPRARKHIEVVGGLIQQEEVRLHEQRLPQRDPHPPPATEFLGWLLHHLLREPKPGKDNGGVGLGGIAVHLLQPLVHLIEADASLLLSDDVLHELLLHPQQPLSLLVRLEHSLERTPIIPRAFLLHVDHVHKAWDFDESACDGSQQGTLANTVTSNHAVVCPVSECEGCSVKQFLPTTGSAHLSCVKRDSLNANVHVHVGTLRRILACALEEGVLPRCSCSRCSRFSRCERSIIIALGNSATLHSLLLPGTCALLCSLCLRV
mmetsp:Transcript_11005/g.22140  ORF Transcript_11005/g.22140 Transcript_11005/m.22140 type:complete len:294 (+) Transcript_11005:1217-2098(+)